MPRRQDELFIREKPKRRGGCLITLLILVLALAIALTVNAARNGRADLTVQRITIATLPAKLEGMAILHISDLHGVRLGQAQSGIAELLKGVGYKAVCLTGDMAAPNGDYSAFIELIRVLPHDVPIYFVLGDEDPDAFNDSPMAQSALSDMVLAAQAEGAIYLDAPVAQIIGGATVWFSPESNVSLDLDTFERTLNNRREALSEGVGAFQTDTAVLLRQIDYELDVIARTREARTQMKPTDLSIVLSHVPISENTILTLQTWSDQGTTDFLRGVSLILAGHYTAGQWRLPGLGAVYTYPEFDLPASGFFPGDHGLTGSSAVLGIAQYISPGVGTSAIYPYMPMRMFNPPQITRLVLTTKLY